MHVLTVWWYTHYTFLICLETFDDAEWLQENKENCQIRYVCPPSSCGIVQYNSVFLCKQVPYDAVVVLWVYFLCELSFFSMETFSQSFPCSLWLCFFFHSRFSSFGSKSASYDLCISPQFKGCQDPITLSDTFVIHRMNIAQWWDGTIDWRNTDYFTRKR